MNKDIFSKDSLFGVRLGDSYPIKFQIRAKNGDIIKSTDVLDVSITIGSMSKQYSDSELTYDSTNFIWMFPLSQQETFALREAPYPALIRVKLSNGNVVSTEVPPMEVLHSIDREVL